MTIAEPSTPMRTKPDTPTQPVISTHNLDLVFQTADAPVHALSDIDLTIHKGEFVSLIEGLRYE